MASSLCYFNPTEARLRPVIPVTGAITLIPQQSGSIVSIESKAAAYTITLPSPAIPGLEFIIVQNVAAAAHIIEVASPVANTMLGSWINCTAGTLTGATTAGTAETNYNFLAVSVQGDNVHLVSDGTSWYARGMIGVAAGASFD